MGEIGTHIGTHLIGFDAGGIGFQGLGFLSPEEGFRFRIGYSFLNGFGFQY